MDDTSQYNDSWVVKGIIFVKYPKDDFLGMFFGYYSLLVYQIQAVYITLFLWNRDMLTFYCCFCHLLSEIMNYILKHVLKHPRPDLGPPTGGLFEGRYGMPSQHCHCFAFLGAMIILLVFHYYRHQVRLWKKAMALAISTIGLVLQVLSRIYLKYHTVNQCLVGVAFGFLSATVFYIIGLHLFLPLLERLLKYRIFKSFGFKKDLISPVAPNSREIHDRKKEK